VTPISFIRISGTTSATRSFTGDQRALANNFKQTQKNLVTATMKNSIRSLIHACVLLVVFATLGFGVAQAQTVNASLGGIVSDASGARITSANVTLVNDSSHDVRKTTTNNQGVFQFQAVPTGAYTLTVRHAGFSALTEHGIELHPNDVRTLSELTLPISTVSADVTVTTTDTDIATSGERSSLITANDIKKLSTVGRDVTELIKTQAGFSVLQSGLDNGAATDPSVVGSGSGLGNYVGNGGTGNGTSITSDGANVTDPGNGSGQTQTVNMDMVQEVKIETSNFGADTAKGPTVITAVGKSGGSQYHGSVYLHGRTSHLNAEDWYSKFQTPALPPIPDRYLYPGFNIGGPVKIPGTNFNSNKKITFFAGAEDYVQRNVYSYGSPMKSYLQALVPTAAMRQGDFSQASLANYIGQSADAIQTQCTASGTLSPYYHICAAPNTSDNKILGGKFQGGAAAFDPGAAALLSTIPLPTGPTVNGYNYSTLNLENPDLYQYRGRVDVAINDNNKVYAVYNGENGRTTGIPEQIYYSPGTGGTPQGGLDTPGKITSTSTSNTASANFTHIFGARATNEIFGAVSYVANYYYSGNASGLLSSTIGYPYKGFFKAASQQYPQFATYGTASRYGLPLAITPDFSNGRYFSKKFLPSGGDNFSYLYHSHTLKVGFYIERDNANQTDLSPVTNGQISSYYVPTSPFNDASCPNPNTACHSPDNATSFSGAGGNYLADFMLGDIGSFTQQNFNDHTNLYFWTISGFVTDSWKATKKLTLDYGVRLDHIGAWADTRGLGLAIFDPALYASDSGINLPGVRYHGGSGPNTDPSVPTSGAPTRPVFVSPRFGLAYDLYGTGKTILRGGLGYYRSHDSWNDYSIPAGTSQGLITSTAGGGGISLAGVNASSGVVFQCNATSTTGCPSISALDRKDNQQPLTVTYSFTVSQQMPKNTLFEVAYVGNQSHDLLTDAVSTSIQADIQNINAIPLGGLFNPDPNPNSTAGTNGASLAGQIINPDAATTAALNDFRPFPHYTNILVPRHIVYANYNALQTSIVKQKGALNMNLNYTWSRAQGVRGGYNNGLTQDPTNLRANYGPLAFDRTNIFNASYSFDEGDRFHVNRFVDHVINHWFISGITSLQSGPNLQAVYSPNLALSGTTTTSANGALPSSGNAFNLDNRTLLGTPDIYLQPTLVSRDGCSSGNPTSNLNKHQYINGACFGIGPIGVNGPTNLGYIRGPAFFSSDLSLQRSVSLAEKRNLEFRVSAFNFLNHPITAFNSHQTNEASLFLSGTSFANAAYTANTNTNGGSCSDAGSTCFGYAGYKTGRRVLELSGKFNF
jgi:hypothetical protein